MVGGRAHHSVSKRCTFNSLFATFADLHVHKVATWANLHSYTHAYCSFVLLNEASPIVSGSHCEHALLIWVFGFSIRYTGKKIQWVEKEYFQKWCPNSSALQNNVAHRGFVCGKQRVKNVFSQERFAKDANVEKVAKSNTFQAPKVCQTCGGGGGGGGGRQLFCGSRF